MQSRVLKTFIVGITLLSSPYLNAWTIQVLNPGSLVAGGSYSPYNGGSDTQFTQCLLNTGAVLATGSMASYQLNDSDAVIVNCPESSYYYSAAELSVLSSLLNSNVQVLVFGEHSGWANSDNQLATLLGGNYYTLPYYANDQQAINGYPLLTDGVTSFEFAAPGYIAANGNGLALSQNDSITLWGTNRNFLTLLDVNLLSNDYINRADNKVFANNLAAWLSGATPIPESSAYTMLFALTMLLSIPLRRQRKQKSRE